MLEVCRVSFERNKRTFLKSLSFKAFPQQIIHIVGANGVGKTTLLQILTGLVPPSKGVVLWRGESVRCSAHFKQNVLYVGHRLGMKKVLTPEENLYLLLSRERLLKVKKKQKQLKHVNTVLEKIGLQSKKTILTEFLSAGEQRRLTLAKLLLRKADCWILDEPFTALDNEGMTLVSALIEEQKSRGGLVIFTSHQSNNLVQAHVKKIYLDTWI